jgi:hypothetical protein
VFILLPFSAERMKATAVSVSAYSCVVCTIWMTYDDCWLFDVVQRMCSLNLNLNVYQFGLYKSGYKCGISVDKCHYVRAYCCYGISDVKRYELCCYYECGCEVCVAEKIGYFTYYHGVIISKCEK